MSTTLPPADDRTFRDRWKDFWFAARDPTTLGFIRVVTGLLVIYTHLAYSLDLQAFFGKYGWYATASIDRERHEYPLNLPSFWAWKEAEAPPRVPEVPHRRQAVIQFIRDLPAGAADRGRALHYLERVSQEDGGRAFEAIAAAGRLYEAGAEREKLLTGLVEGRQYYIVAQNGVRVHLDKQPDGRGEIKLVYPEFFLALPPAERAAVAGDLRALLPVLPADSVAAGYVIGHMLELDQPSRHALVQFMLTLPADAAERGRLIDYLDHWSADPRKLYRRGHALVSVWFHVTDPTQMALVHALAIAVMVLFTVGFCTRVTSVLTWIAVIGYVHRTNQILFGMDTMMNILLVYLMVGNSGAALSVDRLIARYRAARASLRRSGAIDGPTRAFLAQAPPSAGANLGIRLIQVHFCFIYLAAGLSKLQGAGWWNGTAFWDVMVNPEFTLMKFHWFEDAVRALASVKPLYYGATAVGVWFTWGLEVAFPFLVWTRARPLMLWMAVTLHAGIGVLMGLNIFELLMMTMLLVFLPTEVIRDRLRGLVGAPRFTFGFDPANPRQARAAALVAAADVDGQVLVEPARGNAVPTLKSAAGPPVGGRAGVAALAEVVRPIGYARYVPGASGLLGRWLFPAEGGKQAAGTMPKTPASAS